MRRSEVVVAALLWVAVLFMLSYKLKVIGAAAVRPLYLPGLALGLTIAIVHAATVLRRGRLTFGRRDEGLLLVFVIATLAYFTLQGLLVYPESIRPLLYCLVTIFVLYMLGVFTAARYGAHNVIRVVTGALAWYCVGNFLLLLVGVLAPQLFRLVQVPPLESGYGIRPGGFVGDPTHFGALLSVTLLLLFVCREYFSVRVLLPMGLLLLGGLVLAGSRNALASLVLGALASLILRKKLTAAMLRLIAGTFVVIGLAVIALTFNEDWVSQLRIVFKVDDPNAYSRLDQWQNVFEFARSLSSLELVLGGGFGFIQQIMGSPYNALVRLLLDHGLIGFVCVFAMMLLLIMLIVTEVDVLTRQAAGALFAYWLSFSMFLDTFFGEFFHMAEFCFWLSAALVTVRAFVPRAVAPPEPVAPLRAQL